MLAISPQGLYVLRQGIRSQHAVCVSTACLLLDVVLIGGGTLGVGLALEASPQIETVVIWISVVMLFTYGARAVWVATKEATNPILRSSVGTRPRRAILGALAVSILDPFVYMDAFLLLPGAAGSLEASDRMMFVGGALAASAMWFYGLGLGGSRASSFLQSARVRTTFDLVSAVAVWSVAGMLVSDLWQL